MKGETENRTNNEVRQRNNGNALQTTTKQRGGITGKGFVKGDPRINRKGRPKSFDQLRKLAQQIADEEVTDRRGEKIRLAEAILRSWAESKEPMLQKSFMEYAFGKVPDKIET